MSVDGVAQRRRNALGLCTKELCSALFVSGRAAPDVLDHDLTVLCTTFAGGVLDPAEISFDVDHRRGAVVGTLPDGSSRRAVASGDKGAALVEDRRHDLPGRPLRAGDPDPREWPHGDGFRPDPRYAPLHDGVRAHLATTGARGVAVVHRGALVAQDFAPGFGPDVPTRGWSTAKTLTALIVGWLAGREVLDPRAARAPVSAWRGEHDPRADIRLLDLLGLQSGRSTGRREDGSDEMLTDADDYFASVLETDAEGVPLLCGAWYTTPGDLARIGALLLGRGELGGRRVLPEAWIDTMLTESDASCAGRTEGPSALRHPYGASVWLNRDGHVPAAPREMSYALGSLGQAVFVLPEHDLVIARTGLEPTPDHGSLITAVFTALPLCEVSR